MKTTMNHSTLLAWILLSATLTGGCSSFQSPSSEYVKPGQLSVDVSQLPDPNEDVKKDDDSIAIRNIANQMGGGVREESPERLLMQANSYFEQKRYHDSARLYKKYLNTPAASDAQPDLLGTIHYRVGYVANKKTFYKEAQAEYAQALHFAPLNNEYLFAYAKACYDAGDYATADQQFVALLSRAPGYPEAEHYYGLTLLEGSNRANALQPLTNALGSLQANELLADKYYAVGDLASAAFYEKQMIQLAAQQGQPIPTLRHKQKILESAQNQVYAQNISPELTVNLSSTNAVNQVANPQQATVALGGAQTGADNPNVQVNLPFVAMAPAASSSISTMTPGSNQTPGPIDTNITESHATSAISYQQIAPSVGTPQPSDSSAVLPPNEVSSSAPSSVYASPKPSLNDEIAPPAFINIAPISENNTQSNVEIPTFTSLAPTTSTTGSVISNYPPMRIMNPASPNTVPQDGLPATPTNSNNEGNTNDDWDDSAFATSGTNATQNGVLPTQTPHSLNAPTDNLPSSHETFPIYAPHVGPETNPSVAPGFSDFIGAMRGHAMDSNFTSLASFEAFDRVLNSAEYRNGTTESLNGNRIGYLSPNTVKSLAKWKIDASVPKERLSSPSESAQILARDVNDVANEDEYCDHFSLCAQGEISDLDGRITNAVAEIPTRQDKQIRSTTHLISTEQLTNVVKEISVTDDDVAKKRKVRTTVNLGPSNPGLCVVSMTAPVRERDFQVFRPGSIAQNDDSEQNQPDEIASRLAMQRNQAPKLVAKGQITPQPLSKKPVLQLTEDAALDLYDLLVQRESIESCYLKFNRPEPLNLKEVDQDDVWDDAAFANSGMGSSNSQTSTIGATDASNSEVSGFGDYQPPAARVALLPSETGAYYGNNVSQQTSSPNGRSKMTPGEKLQAARNAGAEVVELTPEQYRSAVVRGIGAVPQR